MKILLTGGAGFIAGHIAKKYLESGYQVFIIDKKPEKLLRRDLVGKVKYFCQDLTQKGTGEIFARVKPDIVNHHAALISVPGSQQSPSNYEENNVLATIKLLELAQKYQIKQFLFASSVAVYGNPEKFPITENFDCNPNSFYGLNKFVCEKYIHLFSDKFKTAIFRYANVFGPFQDGSAEGGVVAIFANNLVNNKSSIIYGDGKQTRDLIFVEDIAQANLLATQKLFSGLLNISSNKEISINNLYFLMQKKYNPGNKINPIYQNERVGDIKKSLLDNHKAQKLINWQPSYDLETSLFKTLNFFESNAEL